MAVQDTGYTYYPSKYSPPLGHPRLDVYLQDKPSHRYFDVHKAIFPVVEPDGFRELTITHPWEDWMGPEEERICAGRFQLIDSNEVSHFGFSLGGNLKIQNLETYTLCTLTSSAPIFNLMGNENQTAEDLMVNEIEVLLAQRMAFWGKGKTDFCKRVYEAEPLTLFLSALVELKKEIQKLPLDVREHGYQGFSQIIDETVHTLEEASDWPETVPLIADLI